MLFGLAANSRESIFSKQPSFQSPKPDGVMDELPVDDPAAWKVDSVVTLPEYFIRCTKVALPFRGGINDHKTLARHFLNHLPAIFLVKGVTCWSYTSKEYNCVP
jgi:hypothetical protein